MRVVAPALHQTGTKPESLEPAEALDVIRISGDRVEFVHPLLRSIVYHSASPSERRRAHRALAEVMTEERLRSRRAWHLALAAVGPDESASSALEQAGTRARDRSAYDVASRAFERAAVLAPEEPQRALLFHAAADAAWLAGLGERSASLLDEAARHATDEPLLIEIEHLRGHIALRRGPLEPLLHGLAAGLQGVDVPGGDAHPLRVSIRPAPSRGLRLEWSHAT